MTCRLLVFCLSLTLLSFPTWNSLDWGAVVAQEAPAKNNQSEFLLPASTKAWLSIPDYERLQNHFKDTDLGKLTQDEKLRPFISSLEAQFKNWLNQQNLRLGVKVEDLKEVRTGEICVAGVLRQVADGQEDKLGRGSHGMVLLVDVSKTEEQAKKLMVKVDKDFSDRGAKRGDMKDIHGVKVTKWTVLRPKMLVKTKSSYHAIAGGWLLVSDNENIFREIIRRLTNVQKVNKAETLALQPAFKSVVENTSVEKVDPDVRWYVDPFGYLELAQAIEREDQVRVKRENDVAGMLKNEGFNVLRGVGGFVSFATGEHELLHRTFVHAPRNVNGMTEKRFFGLFDFENKDNVSFAPADWVPSDISA